MRVIGDFEQTWLEHETVLTIGVFDGVHRGHQLLVGKVIESARASGRQSGLVTFYPHPDTVLTPDRAVPCITTPGEKAALLERAGLDLLVFVRFTLDLAQKPADEFVQSLVEHLHPAEFWIGQDFTFGRNREGNAESLRAMGRRWGFDVHVVPPVVWNGSVVSSSRIRRLLAEGDMEAVAELLNRYYTLAGEVIPGQKRGRALGFPTANLSVRSERALPRDGVYACFVLLGKERFPAVANLGFRPTFNASDRVLEVHLIDMDINLYGCDLVVEFVRWLRPERRFESPAKLVEQMRADVEQARRLLHHIGPREFEAVFGDWRALMTIKNANPLAGGFSEIEHTADRAVEVWAPDLNGLFVQAARAMFSLMANLDTIIPTQRHEVSLDAEDMESALIEWLNELLFWREARGELYSQFGVSIEDGKLYAWFAGQPAQPTGAVVKAATFHELRVQRDKDGMWRAKIVFDT